jgi:hypothetical protein
MIALDIVPQERRRLIQVDYENVEIAIVIEVAECASPAGVTYGERRARLVRGKLLETAPAEIPE